MTDIPAYDEKEISIKGHLFYVIRAIDGRKTSGGRLFCADRFTASGDAGFETTETECRRGTETRNRTAGEWLRFTPIVKKRYPLRISLSCYKSDRRGSNPRSRPWQGRALPTTPLSHLLSCVLSCAWHVLYNT